MAGKEVPGSWCIRLSTSPQKASAIRDYFLKMQRKYGYEETGNIVTFMWDLRIIADQINNDDELKQLIEFYIKLADNPSAAGFKNQYSDYLDSMRDKKRELAHLEYLKQQTVKGKKKVEL